LNLAYEHSETAVDQRGVSYGGERDHSVLKDLFWIGIFDKERFDILLGCP
jgi:hypothetical protein